MLYLEIDRTHERAFSKQIYTQIREKILSGGLSSGDMLPSTRELSKTLCVARNTILTAYDILISEGMAYSVPGSGVYVSSGVTGNPAPRPIGDFSVASLSDFTIPNNIINFDSGLPALDLFPRGKWNHTAAKAFNEAPISALGYDNPQGRPELREILSTYLNRTRGIACHPDQIIITTGTKQGLSLVAKCLLNAKSEVWIENPSNENVKQIFSYHTDKITPFEVDEEGIQPDLFYYRKKPALILAPLLTSFRWEEFYPSRDGLNSYSLPEKMTAIFWKMIMTVSLIMKDFHFILFLNSIQSMSFIPGLSAK